MGKPRCTFRKSRLNHDVKAHNRLRTAIRCRNKDLVQRFADEGVNVNGAYDCGYREFDPTEDSWQDEPTNHPSFTPLHLAVISRNAEIVRILLDKGANVNAKVWNGETPLTMAAKMQNSTIIDLLLNHESIQNLWDYHDLTHLHIACMRNNVEVAKKLLLMNEGEKLNEVVDSNSSFWAGYSPLHFAVHFEGLETVRFLIECGADITKLDERGNSPLHLAHVLQNEEIIDLILKAHKNESKNPTNSEELSHFHIACTRDDPSVVEHFLKTGVNINDEVKSIEQWKAWRPLHFAMLYECHNVIRLLLRNKVDLESRYFPELLECAYITENESIYSLFLDNVIYSDSADKKFPKLSVFRIEYREPFIQCMPDLIEKLSKNLPSDLDTPIWNGWTPLHVATKYGNLSLVKILLSRGANIMAQDAEGKTPIHLAFMDNRRDMISLEMTNYLDTHSLHVKDNEGLSIFHILCALGHIEAIQNFLLQGVDVNCQVGKESVFYAGFTPMHFAVKSNNPKVLDILLKHGADVLLTNSLNLNPFDFAIHRVGNGCYYTNFQRNFEILTKILLDASSKGIQLNYRGISILHGLCTLENTESEQINQLIIAHLDEINRGIEFSPWIKYTPLHVATICFRRFDIAKLLLENGADPLLINSAGNTFIEGTFLFGMPEEKSRAETVRLIAESLREKNLIQSHFHLICGSGLMYLVKNIMEVYGDTHHFDHSYFNSLNDLGQTPLHSLMRFESEFKKDGLANLLLKNGTNVQSKDFELQTALHYAQLEIEPNVTRILVKYGANVNAQNIFGETALHKLLYNIQEKFTEDDSSPSHFYDQVTSLLEGGCNIDITDRRGQTCLMIIPHLRANDLRDGIACILLKHVKKLQLIGYYVNDRNKQACSQISESVNVALVASNGTDFVEKCEQELKVMRSEYIDRYTTLYSILFKSLNSMTVHCQNVSLQNMIQLDEFIERFPVYGYLIRLQVKYGQMRQPLLNQCEKILRIMFSPLLPSQCVNAILDHLSNEDLENIIEV